ncbi:hypothetical protein J8273_7459 [Carpediemonas membranifera]|uniref:LSM domain-containing protein n=1 Tax=Carpediemonas membranifera TaxID=201153 RepID=A0A8J6ATM8_9EUKA|nr:hypothetical protein J8273_7459 [Carpediemonas membranifera]|eukprot:KAG9391185.1 hypothetical protein J8273_7459 [Carpediemonas membranifera]
MSNAAENATNIPCDLLGRKAFVMVQADTFVRSFYGTIQSVDYRESLVLSDVEERTVSTYDDHATEFVKDNHVVSRRELPIVLINREDMIECRIR